MAASLACSVQAGKDLVKEGKRERKIQSPFLFVQPTDAMYVSFFCFVEFFYGGAAMRADMSKKP